MKFSRRQTFAALGATLAMPYVRPSWAQSAVVNVYNWADYIAETTLDQWQAGVAVNIEVDTIARYLERLLLGDKAAFPGAAGSGITLAKLADHGFMK